MASTQNRGTLRQMLFEQTHEHHQLAENRFDKLGVFSNPECYRQWLQAMLWLHERYRGTITTAAVALNLAPVGEELTAALDDDVKQMSHVVKCAGTPATPLSIHTTNQFDEQLGALYVFEGSGMGAQILYKRALAHQLQPLNYLSRAQAISQGRWPAVVKAINELGESPDVLHQRCADAAKQVFTDLSLGLDIAAGIKPDKAGDVV